MKTAVSEETSDTSEALSGDASDVFSEVEGGHGQDKESVLVQRVPLYPEAHVTTNEFNLALTSFIQRHNLTYTSQTDILKLLSIVYLPQVMCHLLLMY